MITMRTIEQHTPLEIIDYVTPLLLAQNAKSQVMRWGNDDDKLSCAYRGNDGRKCAVGMLMTDEEYAELEADEDKFAPSYRVCTHFGVSALNIRLCLRELQDIHDCRDPSQWADELARLREIYA